MEYIFYSELKEKCREIASESVNKEMIEEVISSYKKIIILSNVARKEGLLSLEEEISSFDINTETKRLLFMLVNLVVDGTDPEFVFEAGMNSILASSYNSYEGFIALMCLRGTLLIQEGANPRVIEELLKTMMPPVIKDGLDILEDKNDLPEAVKEAERIENLINSYSNEEEKIDEHDHSIVGQLSIALVNMNKKDVRRLLRDADKFDLALAMKIMKGQARKRVFDNVSKRSGKIIAESMDFMGPVRHRDIEEIAAKILKNYVRLVESNELKDADVSAIKLVIDMYENDNRKNNEMKDKYRELKALIDEIYN